MKRKALIIGAAYDDPDIPGVYTDLDVWDKFLKSPCGGGWESSEVDKLKDPDFRQLEAALRKLFDVDYAFIVFCGHGATVKLDKPWTETLLYFGNHGTLTDSKINPGPRRCTLLLDCCRGHLPLSADQLFLIEGKAASYLDRDASRTLFDNALSQADRGLVTIYAASVGESASDRRSFSKQLILQTENVMEVHKGVLPQPLAVELTAEAMKETMPQQHPEYNGGRRLNHFPFAVNVR